MDFHLNPPAFAGEFVIKSAGYISRYLISKMLQQLAKNYFVSVIPDCRNPDYKDVLNLPSMALDTRFPASMTDYFVSAESSY